MPSQSVSVLTWILHYFPMFLKLSISRRTAFDAFMWDLATHKAPVSLPTTTKKQSGESVSNKKFQPAQTSCLIAFC